MLPYHQISTASSVCNQTAAQPGAFPGNDQEPVRVEKMSPGPPPHCIIHTNNKDEGN